MSYDMNIGNEGFNYTYNVAKMWYAAQPEKGIRAFYGLTGKEALEVQKQIFNYMVDNKTDLMQYEPSNGWGSFDSALLFVAKLIQASLNNPDEIWEGD
jgi:hypothetical protein